MKFAIFALVSNISALKLNMNLEEMTEQANNVLSRFDIDQDDLNDGDQNDTLNTIKSPWKHDYIGVRFVDHANIGIEKVEETSKDFAGFDAGLHGFVGNNHNGGEWKDAYDRVLPQNFDNSDEHPVDTFTANVIKNYATEGVTKEGKPDGRFFIVKPQAKKLAEEVVSTHLGFKGSKLKDFMNRKFEETWKHYDVNDEGTMDALWASPFMRALCKSEKDIDLQ